MTKRLHLYIISIALIILLIGLPLVNIKTYAQSTITSKFIVFAYSCFAIIGIHLFFIIFSKVKAIYISKIDIILLIIIGYLTLNRYVFQADYSFSMRYLELLGLSILYLVIRGLPIKSYTWLLLAIIISGIIQAVYGNLQLLGYYPSNHSGFKLTGSFFNPGPYAGFLAAVWPVALGMYLFKDQVIVHAFEQFRNRSKTVNILIAYVFEYIPVLGIACIMLVIPSTHSRGAWLSIIISSILLIEYRYLLISKVLKKLNHIKRGILITLTVLIISGGLFGVYHFKKGSSDGRLFIWKVTTEIVKDNPFFGVGFDRFKAHYMNYQANYFVEHGETAETLVADNSYYTFNEWLQYTAENGLVGGVLLCVLLYLLLKISIRKEYKYLYILLVFGLLACAVFAFFSYPLQIVPIKLVAFVLLALLVNLDIKKHRVFNTQEKPKPFILLKAGICILGLIGVVKGGQYTSVLEQNFKTWENAQSSYQYGDYRGAIQDYKKAYSILKKDGDFLMNYGKALSIYKRDKKAVEILTQAKNYLNTTIIETALGDAYKNMKQYKEAEIAYKHAANMIPSRFYPLYLLAKLYEESGEKEKAILMAKTILNKKVKIASTAIEEIKEEMKDIITNE
ncbi:O-antigen ligase family protein [Flavivirga rizhaonensis]|uniref:O-antigen ligase-related domain-containing protein n=1 Tax=Flavivirga rizhaonensis TaxID=2559571 RepID=A0A4S1DZH3_9FLAO|nr:O-antigen ligase family protein [Flavivirga rizhaonensis]TGV03425.1 hypothetical protein EM932_07065 [Flavivirga rizhaonensis]